MSNPGVFPFEVLRQYVNSFILKDSSSVLVFAEASVVDTYCSVCSFSFRNCVENLSSFELSDQYFANDWDISCGLETEFPFTKIVLIVCGEKLPVSLRMFCHKILEGVDGLRFSVKSLKDLVFASFLARVEDGIFSFICNEIFYRHISTEFSPSNLFLISEKLEFW